jgi:hypothetical protein
MPTTYIQRDVVFAAENIVATYELSLLDTTQTAATISVSVPASASDIRPIAFTGPEVGLLDWPVVTDGHTVQADVTAAGSNLSYRPIWVRITSDTTTALNAAGGGTLSGTGLKTWSLAFSSANNNAGRQASDRLQVQIGVSNGNTMSAQTLSLRINISDSFVRAPWDTATSGLTAVASALQTVWHARSRIGSALGIPWNVAGRVASQRSTVWHVTERVPPSVLAALWDVRSPAAISLAAPWNVAARTSSALSAPWHITDRQAVALAAVWDVARRVRSEAGSRWNVGALVDSSLGALWDVAGALAVVGSELSARWDLAERLTSVLSASWEVRGRTSAPLVARWDVLVPLATLLAAQWDVASRARTELGTTWNVTAPVLATLLVLWDIGVFMDDRMPVAAQVQLARLRGTVGFGLGGSVRLVAPRGSVVLTRWSGEVK